MEKYLNFHKYIIGLSWKNFHVHAGLHHFADLNYQFLFYHFLQ